MLSERNTTADNFSIAVVALATFSVPQPIAMLESRLWREGALLREW